MTEDLQYIQVFKYMNAQDKSLAKIFGVLANPIRLKIYTLILEGACNPDPINDKSANNCATRIAKKLKLNQPTVSNHIKELTNAHLIVTRKVGKHAYLYGVKKTSELVFEFGSLIKKDVNLSSKSA